jgi:hypothetical protein
MRSKETNLYPVTRTPVVAKSSDLQVRKHCVQYGNFYTTRREIFLLSSEGAVLAYNVACSNHSLTLLFPPSWVRGDSRHGGE